MLNQKQINEKIKEEFVKMQECINAIEKELTKEPTESNQALTAFHFGKLQEQYMLIVDLMEIFK